MSSLIPAGQQRPLMAALRRPALGTADPKPASQNVVLNVSKVAINSPAGAPGIGHDRVPGIDRFLEGQFVDAGIRFDGYGDSEVCSSRLI